MKYLCLIYEEEQKMAALPQHEITAMMGEGLALVQELDRGGHHITSMPLQSVDTAISVRSRDGKLSTTDGPFAETKEQLGGFCLIEAHDLNEAIQLASKIPAVRYGTVEVRPVMERSPQACAPGRDEKIGAALRTLNGS